MTSIWFTISLGLIGLASGALGFSEQIAKNKELSFFNKLWFKFFALIIITVTTIIGTISYNSFSDAQNDIKLKKQHSDDSTTLADRDSANKHTIEQLIAKQEQRLINSNLYYDSALKRYIQDSAKQTITIAADPVVVFDVPQIIFQPKNEQLTTVGVRVVSQQAPATEFSMIVGIAVIYNGQYSKMYLDTMIDKNEIIPLGQTIATTFNIPTYNNVSSYFFHVVLSYKKPSIKKIITEEYVLTYNKLTNQSGYANGRITEEVKQLFR